MNKYEQYEPEKGNPEDVAYGGRVQGYVGPLQLSGFEGVLPVVRLRGLPYSITDEDILGFLGCQIVDIVLLKNRGRFSGEAYVVLPTLDDVELALQKDKSYLGQRYIEIFRSKKLDYYRAVVTEMTTTFPIQQPSSFPSYNNPLPARDMNPRPSYNVGGRDLEGVVTNPDGSVSQVNCSVVKLRGLPFNSNEDDIAAWFQDPALRIAPPRPDQITVISQHGRHSGQAFVLFDNPEDARRAMFKHRQMMGSRYIELFQSSIDEMNQARARY